MRVYFASKHLTGVETMKGYMLQSKSHMSPLAPARKLTRKLRLAKARVAAQVESQISISSQACRPNIGHQTGAEAAAKGQAMLTLESHSSKGKSAATFSFKLANKNKARPKANVEARAPQLQLQLELLINLNLSES